MIESRKKQIEFLEWEFGVFFHFGIRTFYEGHTDWDGLEMPLEGFNPTQLDCDQWVKAAKDSGAKYTILVCKHHDGFANWPSKYTGYSVKNTPWKNGKGDVVREYVDACRKYDMKIGLYYSPAQHGYQEMESREYDDYFINQISELLTDYGKIDYIWFDACGSENHEYDTERIVNEQYRILFTIVIPLSKPSLATVALFTFLGLWNSWYESMLYVTDQNLISLQYFLQRMLRNIQLLKDVGQSGGQTVGISLQEIPGETARMAMAVLVAGPALVVFPFFSEVFR